MRVAVFGQRSFGAAVIGHVVDRGHTVAGVASPHGDRTHVEASRRDIPWFARASECAVAVSDVDVIVCAHSHDFVGRRTRAWARLGAIGFHPSLLPLHRGRDAIRWTIHMGDRVAGGTVYWLSDVVDGGDVADQRWLFVRPDDDATTLWRRLFPVGVEMLGDVIDSLARGVVTRVPQDESLATWEPSWSRPPLHRPELPCLPTGDGVVFRRSVAGRVG